MTQRRAPRLPDIPAILLEETERLPNSDPGFLTLIRRRLRARYSDGTRSEPFVYDQVERRANDAVVICAHFQHRGVRHVYLRSALRPPLAFRGEASDAGVALGDLWELPAGLIEADERKQGGFSRTASRELEEELGFHAPAEAFRQLGPSVFPCPAVIPEIQWFVEIEVDPAQRHEPSLDGSALEHGGVVIAVPLSEALAACRAGELGDTKTELGLRRLAERYPSSDATLEGLGNAAGDP